MVSRTVQVLVVLLIAGVSQGRGQFKAQVPEQARVSDVFVHEAGPSFLFGWFNPDQFHMNHSFSFSYQNVAGYGLSLGTYTNTMRYDVTDNLSARADLSLSYSPYNSFPSLGGRNDLSSLYLSRAEVAYKPWENLLLQVQYRAVPYGYYSPYSSPFYSPWSREGWY